MTSSGLDPYRQLKGGLRIAPVIRGPMPFASLLYLHAGLTAKSGDG